MTSEPTRAPARTDAVCVRDLALRARAGSHAAFGALVERYEPTLFHFLRVRTGSDADAEELSQDSFLRAWRRIDLYDERWAFSTWLFTVAARVAASSRRRAVLPVAQEEPCEELEGARDPGEVASARDERANLWRTAERVLSRDQRSALWLYYAEDLDARDVGRILGKGESTVRVLLFRARQRLAPHLTDTEPTAKSSCSRPVAASKARARATGQSLPATGGEFAGGRP